MTVAADARLIVKPFDVTVTGYPGAECIFARSRGQALAKAWRCDAFGNVSFGAFLKMARAVQGEPGDRFGEAMTVGGKPAFYISHDRQYIQFVLPDSDVVLNTHPLDVEPPEALRGTPYYTPLPSSEITRLGGGV